MDLNQLRTFVAVCEERNVTKAAQRLYMTPPSVSSHIKALEEELNVTLFERSSKGMTLTQKGEILREKAERTLQAAQELVNYATELQAHLMGKLTIGLNAVLHFLRIGHLTQYLQENSPGVELTFVNSVTGRIIEDVRSRNLDAGYAFGLVAEPSLTAQPVGTANLVVAVPKPWAANIRQADWAEMAKLPWIYANSYCPFQEIIDRSFEQRGLAYERVVQADDEITKTELVAAGIGVTLLEETEARQAVRDDKLVIWETEPILCNLSFVYLTNRAKDPLIKTLIAAIPEVWNDVSCQ